jgi:phosphoglycolate phosphatase
VTTTHLFFDLDGTLTDPQEGICACLAHALREMRHPVPAHTELRNYIGYPLETVLGTLLKTEQPETLSQAVAYYRNRFSTVGLLENRVYDGISDMLAALADDGRWSLFVVTAKPTGFAEQILKHFRLDSCFQGVYGSELDGSRIHKRDVIEHALASENPAPPQAVMIGDRYLDIEGAREHGLRSLAVTWGFGTIEELREAGPDLWAHRPDELPALLREA